MDILEVKNVLGINKLNLNKSEDKDGKPTDWLRHWDNDGRVAVSIHKDTFDAIKAGDVSTLDIQTETREAKLGKYTAKRIIMYTPAEFSL
jgi:hypothetical protein